MSGIDEQTPRDVGAPGDGRSPLPSPAEDERAPRWDAPPEPRADERSTTFEPPPAPAPPPRRHSRNPVDRLTRGLPDPIRVTVDWIVTIVGAVAIVLLVKAFVINPYRIPSSSMEPTLHCAQPASGCEARFSDRVLANRFIYHLRDPARGEIVVFQTPEAAQIKCGAGGTFVKRLIGMPGETVEVRLERGEGYVYVNGRKLDEPYIDPAPTRSAGAVLRRRPGEGARGELLHDGRQPLAVVRLARMGLRAPGQPDRQGLRDLLAAESDLFPLARNPQERIPPRRIPACGGAHP